MNIQTDSVCNLSIIFWFHVSHVVVLSAGLFDCLPFYNEMLGKNATNSCAICESVNENWSKLFFDLCSFLDIFWFTRPFIKGADTC